MDGWTFLDKTGKLEIQPVYVVAGKEYFLCSLICEKLERLILPESAELARSVYDGDEVDWASVKDDLETPPFGGPRRFVLVREADGFVSKYRERIEKYLDKPSRCGVLALRLESWRSNTRLAKQIPDAQTISCEPRKPYLLGTWLTKWCQSQYGKKIGADAMNTLLELVDPDFGILNQELAKLSAYVGKRETISAKDVDALVGHNRGSTVWIMLDALAAGQPAQAVSTLQHLLEQGEDPMALFGGMTWQLRKLAQTHRLLQGGMSLQGAMAQAGMPPFKAQSVQQHLRQLGPRPDSLFDWLLETEQSLKSSGQLSPEGCLERLLVRLA
jgi:DNA polymerase-3 subunit delta